MKALLNRRTIIIFSTALLLAVISVVSVNVLGSAGPVTGVANVITSPIRGLASLIAEPFSRIFAAMYDYDEALVRIDELTRELALLEQASREANELREENALLREQLGFRQRYRDYESEMALFRGWGGDNWTSTFLINMGSANSNIEKGMPVVRDDYLLGIVGDVGLTESTVITILDTRFSAAAYVGRGDTAGDQEADTSAVAKGDFAYMASGMLVLDQIGDEVIVRIGDTIMTSGRADVFPPGLIIGRVQDVVRNASGIGRFAPISPVISLDNLNTVFVITNYEPVQ